MVALSSPTNIPPLNVAWITVIRLSVLEWQCPAMIPESKPKVGLNCRLRSRPMALKGILTLSVQLPPTPYFSIRCTADISPLYRFASSGASDHSKHRTHTFNYIDKLLCFDVRLLKRK